MRFITSLSNYLERIAVVMGNTFLIAIFILVNIEVVSRYMFHATLIWCEPFSKWMMPWIIFISLGFIFKRGRHISATFLVQKLRDRWPNGFGLCVCLLTLIFASLLLWGGITSVVHLEAGGFHSVDYPFPRWIVYLAVPIGASLLIFHVIESIIKITSLLKATQKQGGG